MVVTRDVPQIILALVITWLLTRPYESVDARGTPLPEGIVLDSPDWGEWYGREEGGEAYAEIVDPGTEDERLVLTGRWRDHLFEVVSRTDARPFAPTPLDRATPESIRRVYEPNPSGLRSPTNAKLIVRHVGKVGEFVDAEMWFEIPGDIFPDVYGSVHVLRRPDRASP